MRVSRFFLTIFATVLISGSFALAADLKPGEAFGTFMADRKTTKITHVATFVDETDEQKPVILVLSDRELPVSTWKSNLDFMTYRLDNWFIGVALWLDKKKKVYNAEYYDTTHFPTSASGLFEVALAGGKEPILKGYARTTEAALKLNQPVNLDVSFNALPK